MIVALIRVLTATTVLQVAQHEVHCVGEPWTITVDHDQRQLPRHSLRLVCVTAVPLSRCMVRVYDDQAQEGHVHELSAGTGTALYHGAGLPAGECGILVTETKLRQALVTCRVKAAGGGGWREETITFDRLAANRTSRPTQALFASGDNRTVSCESPTLGVCELQLPGNGRGVDSIVTPYTLHGTTNRSLIYEHLDASTSVCRFDLLNLTDGDAGPAWCETLNDPNVITYTTTVLTPRKVLSSVPRLTLTSGTVYEDGDLLTATCTVAATMPVTNIEWRLGSTLIEGAEHVTDVDDADWPLPWQGRARKKKLSIKVGLRDNHRDLKCIASQLELRKQSKMKISVTAHQGCGKRAVQPTLISKGQRAHPGEFPWHAGLYKMQFGSYQHLCGGTLITKTIVITAAHCFTTLTDEVDRRLPDMHLYKVVLGKHHRSYYHVDDGAQAMDVANVSVPFNYAGSSGNYQHDIAVVRLARAVLRAAGVGVVCIDWDGVYESVQLAAGQNGIIAGWGLEHNRTASSALQWVSLPWVTQAKCREALPPGKLHYLTYDKLCAGYVDTNVSVCAGDSGGGLTFHEPASRRYYLRGVSSISFDVNADRTCYTRLYAGFTAVAVYLPWIRVFVP